MSKTNFNPKTSSIRPESDKKQDASRSKGTEPGANAAGDNFKASGADPYKGDRLGRLGVSKDSLKTRDRMVLRACRNAGVPVAVVMSGGYASPISDTVDVHFNTVRVAAEFAVE